MIKLLSVDTIFFTLLGYPMSYLEFVGTLLYLWSVWLIAQRRILTWPVGIVAVLLYMLLFYQIRLYSDALEQIYYLGASVYGWRYWARSRRADDTVADFEYGSVRGMVVWIAVTLLLSAALGGFMARAHLWAPRVFPEEASYPFLDALTTVMSLVAMWLMARKQIESWIYWILVDLLGVGIYFAKGVRFVSLLYVVLLVLALRGLRTWRRARAPRVHLSSR